MNIKSLKLPGCFEIQNDLFSDQRGVFVKTYRQDIFNQHKLAIDFKEEYYSISRKGVIRGLHFQTPPYEHEKIVYCCNGSVMDVIVDLRVGSPTYGEYELIEINAERANAVYIPKGMAHGFQVLSDCAIMMYKVTSLYESNADSGVKWNSLDIPWKNEKIIISERDKKFVCFADFRSPFIYKIKEG